ncbi:MAG: GxxExxY protein [bacterium]
MKIPFVENKFVCAITAIQDRVDFYDMARLKTYMKALGTEIGLLVNFGKKQLEIQGISV